MCAQMVLSCMYFARSGRPGILLSYAWAVTKWNRACDKRLARLRSCRQYTSDKTNVVMLETEPVNANMVYFKTLDIWPIQSQHHVECSCIFGDDTFVPGSWACKNRWQCHTASRKLKRHQSKNGKITCVNVVGYCDWRVGTLCQSSKGRPFSSTPNHNSRSHTGMHGSANRVRVFFFEDDKAVIKNFLWNTLTPSSR